MVFVIIGFIPIIIIIISCFYSISQERKKFEFPNDNDNFLSTAYIDSNNKKLSVDFNYLYLSYKFNKQLETKIAIHRKLLEKATKHNNVNKINKYKEILTNECDIKNNFDEIKKNFSFYNYSSKDKVSFRFSTFIYTLKNIIPESKVYEFYKHYNLYLKDVDYYYEDNGIVFFIIGYSCFFVKKNYNLIFCISIFNINFSLIKKECVSYNYPDSSKYEMIGKRWTHQRRDGGPDRRFSNNAASYRYFRFYLNISYSNKICGCSFNLDSEDTYKELINQLFTYKSYIQSDYIIQKQNENNKKNGSEFSKNNIAGTEQTTTDKKTIVNENSELKKNVDDIVNDIVFNVYHKNENKIIDNLSDINNKPRNDDNSIPNNLTNISNKNDIMNDYQLSNDMIKAQGDNFIILKENYMSNQEMTQKISRIQSDTNVDNKQSKSFNNDFEYAWQKNYYNGSENPLKNINRNLKTDTSGRNKNNRMLSKNSVVVNKNYGTGIIQEYTENRSIVKFIDKLRPVPNSSLIFLFDALEKKEIVKKFPLYSIIYNVSVGFCVLMQIYDEEAIFYRVQKNDFASIELKLLNLFELTDISYENIFVKHGSIIKYDGKEYEVKNVHTRKISFIKDGICITTNVDKISVIDLKSNNYINLLYQPEDCLTYLSMVKDKISLSMFDNDYVSEYRLKKLCSQNILFKYSNDVFFTIKKLIDSKIYFDSIKETKDCINNILLENYCSLGRLDTLWPKNPFADKYISTDGKIGFVTYNMDYRVAKIFDVEFVIKRELKISDLKELILIKVFKENNIKSIDVYDFVKMFNKLYDAEINYEKFVNNIEGNLQGNIYYSNEMEKLYIDKNEFYKEVYDGK